jgi:acetoin utilization deacetylase AcuC-like enzyme/GNAT superfamily N-acetyltransferase
MFRIRRVFDNLLPVDRAAIGQVQNILRSQFPDVTKEDIAGLPEQLHNPFKYRFRFILFVAEDSKAHVRGFVLMSYEPTLNFCYVDFVSAEKGGMGRGIGGALYERVREEALSLKTLGLFYECLSDDPKLLGNTEVLRQNRARLRFFERYGARPITNNAYDTPLKPEYGPAPYLIYDDLRQHIRLRRDTVRSIVRAILERKYGDRCPPGYIDMVVESFKDDPARLRKPRYVRLETAMPARASVPADKRIFLVVNDQHTIHHVRERGYVESPIRIKTILSQLERTDLFTKMPPQHFPEKYIRSVHDSDYVDYFKKVCSNLKPGESVYPYVFPIRNMARPPKELTVRAGYYCVDTFTPLNRNAYLAARMAVDCALTAAKEILGGRRLAYALVRPPGHHAERRSFGGFCYFNSAAIAAEYLSSYGKVAILDLDYHHGNGQQNIFYRRSDVLTISIHGHPNLAYPYFSGFKDEKGAGAGRGYNMNVPLPEIVDGVRYRQILDRVLKRLRRFQPRFLVVTLGLDTAKRDPTGTWSLQSIDFEANARMVGSLRLPTLVVQEGGYNNRVLGIHAIHFFRGLWDGAYSLQSGETSIPRSRATFVQNKQMSGNMASARPLRHDFNA